MQLHDPLRACARISGRGKKILFGSDVTLLSFAKHADTGTRTEVSDVSSHTQADRAIQLLLTPPCEADKHSERASVHLGDVIAWPHHNSPLSWQTAFQSPFLEQG